MRQSSAVPPRPLIDSIPRIRPAAIVAALSLALLASGCSGARPELMADGGPADPGTQQTGDATADDQMSADQAGDPGPTLQAADCVTASGPGPWPVTIETTDPPAVACVQLANHHRVEFINNTPDPVGFELAGLAVTVEPAGTFVTEPAGSFLQPGLTRLNATPHPVSGLWVAGLDGNTLAGQPIGLNSIGAVTVGATPVEMTAALGGAAVAASDQPCYVTTIAGDPYTPLFTISEGKVAVVQVFTPGQLTRSEVGVGASEGDVLAAYGQQIESQPSPDGDPAKKLLVFVPVDADDQQYRLVFVVENGVVVGLRNGLTDLAINNPNCGA